MLEFFRRLFASDFMPHGMCQFWRPSLIWLHVTSDALTALAYFCIPFTLVYLVRRRRDLVFNWMFVLFGVFILACGATHVMSIWTLWHGTYRLDGLIKAITAMASVPTALLLIHLMPEAVKLPSPSQLRAMNQKLEAEIADRRVAEQEVRRLNADLERRVAARTAELEHLNEILRRSNEDLSRYAWAASHDLQEPLRTVALFSEIVGRRYPAQIDEEGKQFLAHINEGAHRMQKLLSDLLTYSQVGEDDGGTRHASGNEAFDHALVALETSIAESQAAVTRDDLPLVAVQETHLLQILQNLIGNSVKYRSGVLPRIHVAAERSGRMWRFTVRDNGIGIDPQYATTIFGLFKRVAGKEYAGTGIGLALCQRIVTQYGGRIWVESALGEGATFSFTLPSTKPCEG